MRPKKKYEFNFKSVAFDSPPDLERLSARADLTDENSKSLRAEPPKWRTDHVLTRLLGKENFSKFCKSSRGREVFIFDCQDTEMLEKYFNVERLRKVFFKKDRGIVAGVHKKDPGLDSLAQDFYDWTELEISIDLYGHPKKSARGQWHWDSIDKFLFFIEGDGKLEIYKPLGPLLLPQQNIKNIRHIREEDSKLVQVIPKRPGRIVYVPRGVPHRHVFSQKSRTMHAPVWLQPVTLHGIWSCLTQHALMACESHLQFRQAVGPNEISKLANKKSIQKMTRSFAKYLDPNLLQYMWRKERILQQHTAYDSIALTKRSRERLKRHPRNAYFQRTSTRYDLNDQFGIWELILPRQKVYFADQDKKIFTRILRHDRFELKDLKRMSLSQGSIQKILNLLLDQDLYRVEIA